MTQTEQHAIEESEVERIEAIVPEHLAGKRFDQALAEMFPEFSRSRLTEWIKAGDALLDGVSIKPKASVNGGETVTLAARVSIETDAVAEAIDLDILYSDADVIVLDKPAGLVVHPGAGNANGTLVNALLHFDAELAHLPRAGIVHRLDKDTSGLMVVARSLRAHAGLIEQLSSRAVHRQYVAVVQGPMVAGGTVDAPIDRHPRDRVRMAVSKEGQGRDAITHYRVRDRFRAHTVLECRLETGRTHQIRVHMAHIRHPLIGDPLYGGAFRLPKAASENLVETLRAFKRQALHAEKLSFTHPVTQQPMAFESPLPADMVALIGSLRDDTRQFNAA
jgi:23S rRNA pseudouridine1911/1915/1917 synthase